MPLYPNYNIPPYPYPRIPPHPIFVCPYFTSAPMYSPYVVPHHPYIPSLGHLYRPSSRIPSSMLPNLLPPEVCPHSSRMMSEQISIITNQLSNEINHRRRYYSK